LLSDVEDVCDRVVVYYGGKIQAMGTLKELLAKPDAVRITMPPLSRETMQKVLTLIQHEVPQDKVEVDTPTQNLESYFLEVVRKARENSSETSGATSGSVVAAYLRGDAAATPPAERILERLSAAPAPTPAPIEPAARIEKDNKVNERKLAGLARAAEPPLPAPPVRPEPPPADLGKANEKLSSLLGKSGEPPKQ
jgi:ABC-2 type transport system ATP-binding protein